MSSSYKQLRFITFICMLTLGQCLTSKFIGQKNHRVIIIDQDGRSDLECCMYGNCYCSNLSLALEHIQDNTEIRIQSAVSLHNAVVFENVSNIKITGSSNAIVRCDHQGSLVGKNINYIAIQGITWDTCNGITMLSFTHIYIMECKFLNFINFGLKLHGLGSVNIYGSVFSDNSSNVDVLAPYIAIHSSKFYGNNKSGLVINTTNISGILLHSINVIIERCKFNNILELCVHCMGSASLLPNLSIISSNFMDNGNTAVNVEHCNITLNNVTFYNNVNNGCINDGGAIRILNGTINMTGNVLFYYNRAGNNGGAVYLKYSVLYASQGSFVFHNNTAKNGGAIYIGEGAKLQAETCIEFLENNATSYGGAVYVDLHYINDATVSHQLSSYYYNLLTSANCTCDFSNTADIGNCAYFNENMLSPVILDIENHHPNFIAVSCCIDTLSNSTVYVNATTDINSAYDSLKFWSHDLHLAITMDCYSNPINPINVSFQCCNSTNTFCIIDTENASCVVTGTNTVIECINSKTITCKISTSVCNPAEAMIHVTVQRLGHKICDDIAHVYSGGVCLPVCLSSNASYTSFQNCWSQDILPGYWYDNGFTRFVTSCPIGHCNQYGLDYVVYTAAAVFPDRDLQCKGNWGGLACGECNYSGNYSIKYDTEKCIPVHKCLLDASVTYNLLILFAVSFFYWIIIIAFIFVLLHFKFDITAGYAYGLLFYYSVLEQLVHVIVKSSETFNRCYVYDYDDDYIYDYHDDCIYDYDDDYIYEFMRHEVLPFLSSIGILKVPFTRSMHLCFGEAKMIDHLMLGYIHPLIVTFLVVIIYISARNFVLVARTIGRYVNSKSICIFLLLSYNSVTYNSMQLLKPLLVFNSDNVNSDDFNTEIRVYWSPTVNYFEFHDHHLWYGIIAILCELIIGIGIPLVLIFQRYIIRYFNINFTGIKPISDQLKGCYKEEYRWFAAYYLICRQVFYGVNCFSGFLAYHGTFETGPVIIDTPFSEFTIILTVSIMIMLIHVWFQPYKTNELNILDGFILLTLIGLLVSSLEVYKAITVVFWFLPLLILVNYFAYFTKLKHLMIPCSCAAIFIAIVCFSGYLGITTFLFGAISVIVFITYIVSLMKCLYSRRCKTRPRYLAINEQNDDIDENNDNNITEVSYHEH